LYRTPKNASGEEFPSRRSAVDLWFYPWWTLGLFSLIVVFTLLVGLFLASHWMFEKKPSQNSRTNHATASMALTPLRYTTPERADLYPNSKTIWSSRVERWMTRIFIAVVLQSTGLYLVSAYPGTKSPPWLGIILQGFIYGSATIYLASRSE